MVFDSIDVALLAGIVYLLRQVINLDGRVKGLSYTLDQVTNQMTLPEYLINDDLRKLISEDEEIKAIKKARETLGLSLVEGKKYIDQLKNDL
ncbi:hypothetical protein [Halobacillus naozhouensis]|uniref:Uncharacterized protein n=1 Tax=Halobacillus naozhouensis TaxID=554880 RepID=A0ABY8J231_9BACI|nr:hypothetical protein [Halobacillus naozhouensis]WFT76559.1 hypothetical protein P9989_09435 [Halobacillus naozhouensis]